MQHKIIKMNQHRRFIESIIDDEVNTV